MDTVRFGIVGYGNMGSHHARSLQAGLIEGASLGAICDTDPAALERARQKHQVPLFGTHQEMLAARVCDAVLIATPHYSHPPIALDAFAAGLHVLSEKPVAVSVNAARKLNEQYQSRYSHLKFGIMFQQRAYTLWRKLREVIASGEVGEIRRVTWIVTDWFRTWAYYGSGGWRATWAGEGGGVLINQCPHNLDLLQWLLGGMMPTRVTAVASIGKTHPIEVEDEVNAILEYPNGATGHFVTSTGEAPGSNRLEIAGDRGKLVAEGGQITFFRTVESVDVINRTSPKLFPLVETWKCEIPVPPDPGKHHEQVVRAFVSGIRQGTPLIAEGVEGVRGLELGNAMLLAGLTRQPVELPMDGEAFDRFLEELTHRYGGRKTLSGTAVQVDLAESFR
ncbi:MAG: Gfo/Idh/MocA family oxidoreductase [Phycisphaerae bacterium]|nr:Gfo/Idh/MocA family oxidoreductase [Phycisphaerae bacterium]MDW8261400.1 Gfo/Idh/MocA family oxidoreductase [Phycisphaerales bacterium]